MSATPNDGGPAFPLPSGRLSDGMALRDYFAGKAIAGIMASRDYTPYHSGMETSEARSLTKAAYVLADAMIAARSPSKESAKP